MIDPNKTYRTRDGRPVRIYATDGGGDYPIHGAFQSGEYWDARKWAIDGTLLAYCESKIDLIEVTLADELTEQIPWEALRPDIRWVAMHNNGNWSGYTHQPGTSQASMYWSAAINTTTWPLGAVNMPEVYLGSWRETLCKRPEDR